MKKRGIKHSLGIRLILIGVLTLVLLIPAGLLLALISERQDRRDEAQSEVSSKWGRTQTISGPILSVPYNAYIKDKKTKELIQTTRYAHFLPDNLNINAHIAPEMRYRGIYEVVVYNSKLKIKGHFSAPSAKGFNIAEKDIHWENAFLSLGISDMKGIKDFIKIKWGEKNYEANPGVKTKDVISSGISIEPSAYENKEKYPFEINLNLNGSSGLFFAPVGKETTVQVDSTWQNPSFAGSFLPVERKVSDAGFSATWKILHLNRNFPQKWLGAQHKISNASFGTRLLLPVDEYQKIMRTAKYAIMFIALTFLTFFMIELLGKKIIHPIQYLLIGLALLVFYTLLLSISEYLVFKSAYLIASSGIILLITLYTKTVLNDTRQTLTIAGVLIILYGYLYTLLQLQDYALLMGSIALFLVLSIVMYLTRKIDWFNIMSREEE